MKNWFLYIVIVALCVGMIIIPIVTFSDIATHPHARIEKVQVVEINGDVIAVVDGSGEVWEFESDGTYFVNEVLMVKFDPMGTESIYDDAIIAVKR
jgi:hypothetical protein